MHILSEIWIYPVKSLGGISLMEAVVEPRGLQYDRRWMLVDAEGCFVTQREIPRMALLGTAIEPPYLTVFLKEHPAEKIRIPLDVPVNDMEKLSVQVWDDRCSTFVFSNDINIWFSDYLNQNLRLVFMPDTTHRWADGRYAPKGQHVSFADGYPFLLIGQASLDDLNQRLAQPLPMNRFRPNFVFTGGLPFEEDTWKQLAINDQPFACVKPCARCILPTTNQETGVRAAEPLKTLTTFRKFGNKILFGQNLVWLSAGQEKSEGKMVKTGDEIKV